MSRSRSSRNTGLHHAEIQEKPSQRMLANKILHLPYQPFPKRCQPVLTVFQTCSYVVTVFQTVFPSSRSESGPNKNTAPRAVITDTAQKAVSPLLREQLLCRGTSYPNPNLRCHPRQPRQLLSTTPASARFSSSSIPNEAPSDHSQLFNK